MVAKDFIEVQALYDFFEGIRDFFSNKRVNVNIDLH